MLQLICIYSWQLLWHYPLGFPNSSNVQRDDRGARVELKLTGLYLKFSLAGFSLGNQRTDEKKKNNDWKKFMIKQLAYYSLPY